MTERRRLHISPFSPELLPTILPSPILKTATNISYHTLQTFPEKHYGYVELPLIEADKIKKKLNRSILKGSKMHIEAARPEKASKRTREDEVADESGIIAKKAKKSKPQREEGVLPGYEIPINRKIKRGWTEALSKDSKNAKMRKDKSDKKAKPKKSSFTDKPECLFKTTLPPTATKLEGISTAGDRAKKKIRGDSDRAVVVHEFENTTKHASFLRNDRSKAGNPSTSRFVDDIGWVDEDGNVVEALPQTRRAKAKVDKNNTTPGDNTEARKTGNTKSDGLAAPKTPVIEDDETSSSGTTSSESDNEVSSEANSPAASPIPEEDSEADHKDTEMASGSAGDDKHGALTDQAQSLSITRSSATPPPSNPQTSSYENQEQEVHPLEALFKRPTNTSSQTPKKPNLEVRTSFSFFDPNDHDGGNGNTKLVAPQTPFTQQDIRQRRQRSAAPTPDTAAPGKTFNFAFEDAEEDGSDEEDVEAREGDTPLTGNKAGELDGAKGEKAESEFSKWFWEHRGETNRAWKKRKREAAKEKRQKENKERSKRR